MSKKIEKLKEGLIADTSKKPVSNYLRTGCDLIDLVLGGGAGLGIKRGVFARMSGINSSGKSFNITEIGAVAKHTYGDRAKVCIHDCEERNTFDTEALYGVAREELLSAKPPYTVEELDADLGIWLKNIKKNEVGIYAVDSLESLTNADIETRADDRQKKYESGKEVIDKNTMGMHTAKFMSQDFFRTKKALLAKTDATVIFLSQMRENVDRKTPYSPKYKATGSPSVLHWLDLDVELKVVKKLGDKERPVGAVIEMKTTKQTAPRPYRSCRYTLYFKLGIDNIGSNLDYLFDLRGLDGELKDAQCAAISWNGKPISLNLIREWVDEFEKSTGKDIATDAKKARKAADGKAGLSVEFHQDYFRNHQDEDVKQSFCDKFGDGAAESYTRDELIAKIESDPDMEKELSQRVIDKWEQLEVEAEAVVANRKRRFQ